MSRQIPRLIVAVALLATAATAQEKPYVQKENVVYGEVHGVGLLMDVFTPKGKSNGLAVVDVISGAWYSDRGKIRDHSRAQTFDILWWDPLESTCRHASLSIL